MNPNEAIEQLQLFVRLMEAWSERWPWPKSRASAGGICFVTGPWLAAATLTEDWGVEVAVWRPNSPKVTQRWVRAWDAQRILNWVERVGKLMEEGALV